MKIEIQSNDGVQNIEDFAAKYENNMKNEIRGNAKCQIFPCPFCAEPDWLTVSTTCFETLLTNGSTCVSCERTAHALFDTDSHSFEWIQTGGPMQPAWRQLRKAN